MRVRVQKARKEETVFAVYDEFVFLLLLFLSSPASMLSGATKELMQEGSTRDSEDLNNHGPPLEASRRLAAGTREW